MKSRSFSKFLFFVLCVMLVAVTSLPPSFDFAAPAGAATGQPQATLSGEDSARPAERFTQG